MVLTTTPQPGQCFRFSDIDPESGRRYLSLRFAHLPVWAQDIVLHMGVQPQRWNELVSDGMVLERAELAGDHTIPLPRGVRPGRPLRDGIPGASRRTCTQCKGTGRQAWKDSCGFCRGTGSYLVMPGAQIEALQRGAVT
jgi:hypothetical protein